MLPTMYSTPPLVALVMMLVVKFSAKAAGHRPAAVNTTSRMASLLVGMFATIALRPPDAGEGHNLVASYLKSSTRNNGDGVPLTLVGLSGLDASRHAG